MEAFYIQTLRKSSKDVVVNHKVHLPYTHLLNSVKLYKGLYVKKLTEIPTLHIPSDPQQLKIFADEVIQDYKAFAKEKNHNLKNFANISREAHDFIIRNDVNNMQSSAIKTFITEVYDAYKQQEIYSFIWNSYPKNPKTPEIIRALRTLSARIQQEEFDAFQDNPYVIAPASTNLHILDSLATTFEVSTARKIIGSVHHNLLNHINLSGHTCYPLNKLIKETVHNSSLSEIKTHQDIISIIAQSPIFTIIETGDGDYIYPTIMYEKEEEISNKLITLSELNTNGLQDVTINAYIAKYESKNHKTLAPEQKEAVRTIFKTDVMIITGPPGSGKSLVADVINFVFNEVISAHDKPITNLFIAPTGIAAQRLHATLGMTIHRALKVTINSKTKEFIFNKDHINPLDNPLIFVDESSMLDVELAYRLLDAVAPGKSKLIFLGDANQLPSVGPGDILRHLIQSKKIKTVKLNKIFRQGEESKISSLAQMVIRGERPKKSHLCNSQVDYFNLGDPDEIYAKVISLYNSLPKDSTQVLFPTRKETTVGTIQLNKIIAQQKHQTTHIAHGDKIVCIKNNIVTNEEGEVVYQQSSFNGELGEVLLTDDKKVKIKTVTNKEITLTPDTVEHAWAISVNKAQGSEYDNVILVLHDSQTIMLSRELLYTAITRAKKHLYIIATPSALFRAVDNRVKPRFSFLSSMFV